MAYYLGIDGGGTKTKFLLADETGAILGQHTGPTCHYLQCGLDGLTGVMRQGIARCAAAAGLGALRPAYIFAACAGYGDVAQDEGLIRRAVEAAVDGAPLRLGNDCENAWAGALGGASGINIVAGTGSIAYGRDDHGAHMRCGGWHHLLGSDEGSGYWLSQQLLHEFTRQSDGRAPRTPLYDAVRQALALSADAEVIRVVVETWKMDRAQVAALSPLAARLAAQGEPFALALFGRAADELSQLALAIRRGLQWQGRVRCSYTGGVFRAGEVLLGPLARHLAQSDMALTPPLLAPDAGAVILAMHADGVKPDAACIGRLGRQSRAL